MSLLASFMNLAGPDLIVILLIVLVLFGAKKLPELARGMGQAIKEFQKSKDEFSDELHSAGKTDTAPPARSAWRPPPCRRRRESKTPPATARCSRRPIGPPSPAANLDRRPCRGAREQ